MSDAVETPVTPAVTEPAGQPEQAHSEVPAVQAEQAAPAAPAQEAAKTEESPDTKAYLALKRGQKAILEEKRKLQAESARIEAQKKELAELAELKTLIATDKWGAAKRLGMSVDELLLEAAKGDRSPETKKLEELERWKNEQEEKAKAQAEAQAAQADKAKTSAQYSKWVDSLAAEINKTPDAYELCQVDPQSTEELAFEVALEHFKATSKRNAQGRYIGGVRLTPAQTLEMVEGYLLEKAMAYAERNKIKSKLAPALNGATKQSQESGQKATVRPASTTLTNQQAATVPVAVGKEKTLDDIREESRRVLEKALQA